MMKISIKLNNIYINLYLYILIYYIILFNIYIFTYIYILIFLGWLGKGIESEKQYDKITNTFVGMESAKMRII